MPDDDTDWRDYDAWEWNRSHVVFPTATVTREQLASMLALYGGPTVCAGCGHDAPGHHDGCYWSEAEATMRR